jgi:protein TonB
MTSERLEMDEFDGLLEDVLRSVANPELPERVKVRTRVWVQEMAAREARSESPEAVRPAVVFSPEVFLAKMQPRRDARSTAAALALHAAAIGLVFWGVATHVRFAAPVATTRMAEVVAPPPMAPARDVMGGGGGQRGTTPVTKGQLPKFAATQIVPPKAPPMEQPKISMPEPSIEVQKDLKMANTNLPNLGMPNSPLVGNSMGNGRGSGMGSGNGAGLGPGSGGNYGGGLRKIGGGVSSPELIFKVDPEFSEEARKAKFMGIVTVNLIVDQNGNPQSVRLVRGVGMGLDQKAIEAVKQYRFKPAHENGKPVAVQLNVEVDFRIF